MVSLVYLVACRLFALVLLLARSDGSKELELLVLRHELSILRRQARRPQLAESDRLVLAALSRLMARRSWQAFLVTPETLLRWHRRIVACRWTHPHRRPGRPPVDRAVRQLIVRLAREDSQLGLRPDRRRVAQARDHGFGDTGAQRAQPCRHPAGTGARWLQLVVVPAPTSAHDRRMRLVHRRHRLAAAVVRAVLRLDRDA
jgi:hypothetical protein